MLYCQSSELNASTSVYWILLLQYYRQLVGWTGAAGFYKENEYVQHQGKRRGLGKSPFKGYNPPSLKQPKAAITATHGQKPVMNCIILAFEDSGDLMSLWTQYRHSFKNHTIPGKAATTTTNLSNLYFILPLKLFCKIAQQKLIAESLVLLYGRIRKLFAKTRICDS